MTPMHRRGLLLVASAASLWSFGGLIFRLIGADVLTIMCGRALAAALFLLAVLVGAELLGFWGILAAIPVAGILAFALREWIVPRVTGIVPPAEPPPMGEPALGMPG